MTNTSDLRDFDRATTEALVWRYHDDLWNGRQPAVAADILDTAVRHHGARGGLREGREAFTEYVEAVHRAFPDYSVAVDTVLVDGNRAASRWTISGTFDGEFFGAAPTGRRFSLSGMTMFAVADERIVELWDSADSEDLWRQLGVGW